MDRARKALLQPSTVSRPEMARTDLGDRSSVREAKRAREEPAQALSGEIPIPSAGETLTIPIPASSDVIPANSGPGQIFQEASSSSGVKRPHNESTTTPNLPGVMSDSDAKRVCSEGTAQPNSPDVSTGSSVKRVHEKSSANDEDEQPVSRSRISNLIAGLHGVNIAEDDEICNGDEVPDEWLDSWYPETHMSQKMVIEAKRKELEIFTKLKVYRVVTRESMKRDEEGKMVSIKWVITNKGTEKNPIAKARLVAREFNTGDKRGELFAGTPGLMVMRTVISWAMTRREDGRKRSIMLADVKTAFLYGAARRSLYVELPPEDPLAASGQHVGKLERAMYGTRDAPMIWQDHLRKTLLGIKFTESVTHPGVFQHKTRDILLCVHVDDLLCTGLRDDLMWLKTQLLKEYELETKLMGDDDDMERTAVYLGRTLEWSEDGLGVRPDQRHVRLLLRELGMESCRSVSTPLTLSKECEGDRNDRPEMSATDCVFGSGSFGFDCGSC